MIDNKKNIEIVVNCLKRHGIRHVVISPGGTNITFVKAVQDDTYFRCYSVVDERSALVFCDRHLSPNGGICCYIMYQRTGYEKLSSWAYRGVL